MNSPESLRGLANPTRIRKVVAPVAPFFDQKLAEAKLPNNARPLTDWGLGVVEADNREFLYHHDQKLNAERAAINLVKVLAQSETGSLGFTEVREALQKVSDTRVDVEAARGALISTARIFENHGLSDYFSDITDREAGTRIITLVGVLKPDSAH